ncbi:Nucleoside-diphosphate-sugar epimerase [Brevibacterium jeotgali]|uniref:Nucleoside-diphosphate-sugar epimerase n=1 Tax=Brevibacterium jeotgali TaxID=1262550 RepID=A0A2H1L576_9MICO|nr:nucleoside-diphosphate-sugar epimerase [Brevibacterium jeotgali]SMY12042.1 Nucleoside-diphosphate-sugar epimerase [Brevibacterium jeotgali]
MTNPLHVLVTGASGLLGSSVARGLVELGHTVTTLQRRPSGVDGARDVQGSVTDADAVGDALSGGAELPSVDAVIHLAAKVSMAGDPSEFDAINIEGTRTLLTAAKQAGVTRWVHISSPSVAHAGSALMGDGASPASPTRARGDYARTKAAGELLALDADADDFRVLALRPHLMFGPRDAQLTERIIDRARAGRMPILGDGGALVDMLYVENAVDAILAALPALERVHGEALVVTNGQPRMIGELLSRLALAGGAQPPALRVPTGVGLSAGTAVEAIWTRLPQSAKDAGDGEPPLTRFLAEQLSTAHWFDQRRTRDVLRWTPRVSMEEGFERLAAHYGGVTV